MKPLSLITLLTLIGFVASSPAEEKGILGMWRSAELDTGWHPQLNFVEEDGQIIMQTWHSQGGEMSREPSHIQTGISMKAAAEVSKGDPTFKFDHKLSFADVHYEVELTPTGLRLHLANQYTDNSGRQPQSANLNFVRGTYTDAADRGHGHGIPKQGWLGVWKNRDAGTRGIAQLVIQDLSPVMMSTWGIVGKDNTLSPKRGSYVELPLDSKEAASMTAKPTIEAQDDHGWATRTFEMTLHEDGITLINKTDYTDPERFDQTIEYEFIRGTWEDQPADQ